MKTQKLLVLLGIVAVVGVALVLMQKPKQQSVGGKIDDTSMASESLATAKYLSYSSEVLGSSAQRRRVLFFYANWCPTCRPADADFQRNMDKFPSDLTLIRVNYNDNDTDAEEKALAVKYGVTYQHTFVQIDAEGNVITKWNGGQTNDLLARIK